MNNVELPKRGDIFSYEWSDGPDCPTYEVRGILTRFVNDSDYDDNDYTQLWWVKFGESREEPMAYGDGGWNRVDGWWSPSSTEPMTQHHLVKDHNGYWTFENKVGDCPRWLEWNNVELPEKGDLYIWDGWGVGGRQFQKGEPLVILNVKAPYDTKQSATLEVASVKDPHNKARVGWGLRSGLVNHPPTHNHHLVKEHNGYWTRQIKEGKCLIHRKLGLLDL